LPLHVRQPYCPSVVVNESTAIVAAVLEADLKLPLKFALWMCDCCSSETKVLSLWETDPGTRSR